MLPRLIATDLDGTLLRSDGTVAPRTAAALAALRARGVETVACTARPARYTVGLTTAAGLADVAVTANGAVLWDARAGAAIDCFPFAAEAAREVVHRLREVVPGGAFAVEGIDSFGHEPGYRTRWPVPDDTVIDRVETLLRTPTVKLLLRRAEAGIEELVERTRDAVAGLVELTFSDPASDVLEMSAAGVSKGSGLAALCAARGIAAAEVVAFGDMPNDAPMLGWAGRGIAMGNAHPSAARAADERTLTNDEHGVAVVLERMLEQA